MILVPKSRRIEAEPLVIPGGLAGHVTLRALDSRGRVVREREFHNMLTDLGLNKLNSQSIGAAPNIYVGTGTTPPQFTDQTLAAFAARVNPNNNGIGRSNTLVTGAAPYIATAFTVTSSIGFFEGNIAELGVNFHTNNQNLLDARALVLDASGSPTVFPIFADEQLAVSYEIRNYVPMTDVESQIYIGSQLTDVVTRAASFSTGRWSLDGNNGFTPPASTGLQQVFSGAIGSYTSAPSGLIGNASSVVADPYVQDSFTRSYRFDFNISQGNGTIRSSSFCTSSSCFQNEYDPPFVKTNEDTMVLRQSFSWARKEIP